MNGLHLIKPTSIVSTGTGNSSSINTNGSVTFSSCATLSLNGVFSANYDNYMVVCRYSAPIDDSRTFRFRSSGTDNSTASSYVFQYVFANSTTISSFRVTQNQATWSARGNTQRAGVISYFYGPFLAQPTAYRSDVADDFTSAAVSSNAGTHNQSTSYDGLTFLGAAASFTGLVAVYGMVK